MTGKKKSIFVRAVTCVWHAIKSGAAFILKHWRLVLLAVLVICLFIWFGASGPGAALGTKLFGQGNAWNSVSTKLVNGMKVKTSHVMNVISSWFMKN